MRHTLSIVTLAILSASSAAFAEQWKVVSRPGAVQRVSIDRDSQSRQGEVISIWTRITPPPAIMQQNPVDAAAANTTMGTDGELYLMQIACDSRLVRISSQTVVGAQVNPFAPSIVSPYTFQPLKSAPAFSLYSALCPSKPNFTSTATTPRETAIMPSTPRRTSPKRNPWPL